MSGNSPPLIQTLTPERWAGWSMDFIGAGYIALFVKNGRCVRVWKPGRHVSFALPWLEKCELLLVDSKLRHLPITSQGDFLSRDQYLVNVSLNVMYQVVDAKRVALEISDPIAALTSAVKDSLGVAISHLRMEQLTNQGRVDVRQYILDHVDVYYTVGFSIEDVRVSDISFPNTRGIIRQVEGMSARQEAEHEAVLKMQIANAGRPELSPPPIQQVNILPGGDANSKHSIVNQEVPRATIPDESAATPSLPIRDQPVLAPTVLFSNPTPASKGRLVNRSSGAIIVLSANPFTIGREPTNTLVLEDAMSSRNHAQIIQIPESEDKVRYQIIDVGSSNGTFVDQQRLTSHQPFWLSAGNVIQIGNQEWTFQLP